MIASGMGRGLWISQLERLFEAPAALLLRERGVRVRVVADHAALAIAAPAITAHPSFYRSVQAVTAPDRRSIWFVASAVRSIREALGLFAHEVVGHYALPEMLGPARFGVLQAQVLRLRDAGRWPELFDQVRLRYERATDGSRRPLDDATFAAEAIAVFAEANVRTSFVQRAANGVRGFLRRFVPDLMLSQGELRQMLWEAGRWVQGQDARLSVADRALGRGVAPLEAPASPVYARSDEREPFYSALLRAIEEARGAPKAATATQWKQWLDGAQRRGECKQAERDWVGVDAWLDQQPGPVTRDALAGFVKANQVEVQEVVLDGDIDGEVEAWWNDEGGANEEAPYATLSDAERRDARERYKEEVGQYSERSDSTKYDKYQLPGGQNYRELLLTWSVRPSGKYWAEEHTCNPDYPNWLIASRRESDGETVYCGRSHPSKQSAEEAIATLEGVNYRSNHFRDHTNLLAHVRFNERIDAAGARVLFLEELQSDRHQQGRKNGYVGEFPTDVLRAALKGGMSEAQARADIEHLIQDPIGTTFRPTSAEWSRLHKAVAAAGAAIDLHAIFHNRPKVPDAPLKKEWPLAIMKRMIRWAAEHGFERLAWTTGDQQASRYDLSKQVKQIRYIKHGSALSNELDRTGLTPEKITDFVGKDVADKIVNGKGREEDGDMVLEGEDLKVGGEGLRAFYDKMLPSELSKYVTKWGARIGVAVIGEMTTDLLNELSAIEYDGARYEDLSDRGQALVRYLAETKVRSTAMRQPCIDITPAMREAAMQGQPLFARCEPGMEVPRDSLLRAVEACAPVSADVGQWKQWLDGARRRGEFDPAEREKLGVDAWLDERSGIESERFSASAREDAKDSVGYKSRHTIMLMRPSQFLGVAEDGYDASKEATVRAVVERGGQFNSLPQLTIDSDGRVIAHEGRHRARVHTETELLPVLVTSRNIRWDQQSESQRGTFDFVELPARIQAQTGAKDPNFSIPFPSRDEINQSPYSINIAGSGQVARADFVEFIKAHQSALDEASDGPTP